MLHERLTSPGFLSLLLLRVLASPILLLLCMGPITFGHNARMKKLAITEKNKKLHRIMMQERTHQEEREQSGLEQSSPNKQSPWYCSRSGTKKKSERSMMSSQKNWQERYGKDISPKGKEWNMREQRKKTPASARAKAKSMRVRIKREQQKSRDLWGVA